MATTGLLILLEPLFDRGYPKGTGEITLFVRFILLLGVYCS